MLNLSRAHDSQISELSDFLPSRSFERLVLLQSFTFLRLDEGGTLFYRGRKSCFVQLFELLRISLCDDRVIKGLEQLCTTFLFHFQPLLERHDSRLEFFCWVTPTGPCHRIDLVHRLSHTVQERLEFDVLSVGRFDRLVRPFEFLA